MFTVHILLLQLTCLLSLLNENLVMLYDSGIQLFKPDVEIMDGI